MKIWKHHCYKKLAEKDDDLEVGFFFLYGTLQGEVQINPALVDLIEHTRLVKQSTLFKCVPS